MTVSARNVTGIRQDDIRLALGDQRPWSVASGKRATAKFRVRFSRRGYVLLPATAAFDTHGWSA